MAKRKKNPVEEPKVETRKQTRMRQRDLERNRRLTLIVGGVLLVALLLVVVGVVSEMVIKPRSVLARVEGRPIITRDFWERTLLQKGELENQLTQLQVFSQQFGDQNIFASQIAQIQSMLSSPLSLGTQVINQMIDEQVIRLKAEEMGVTVSDEEVEEALREQIALRQSAVTVPQATATAEAGAGATATAELLPPTPATAAITDTEALTETEPLATVEMPTPTPLAILTDDLYQEGLQGLADDLRQQAGISLDDYREIIRAQLLTEKMQEAIGEEQVETTEEQIEVRHILIRIDDTEEITDTASLTPTETITGSDEITDTEEITAAEDITATEEITATGEITATEEITAAEEITAVEEITTATEITAVEEVTAATEITATGELTATTGITETETLPGDDTMNEAEALALATEIRERILAGEDFAELALEFSDDPGSAVEGGNLGWVGRGRFVPEFEEAAFALPVGEISEPVRTDFGYHLIKVIGRDEARPKEENQLAQERAQAFDAWLQEQILALDIERPQNLPSRLPSGL